MNNECPNCSKWKSLCESLMKQNVEWEDICESWMKLNKDRQYSLFLWFATGLFIGAGIVFYIYGV